MMPGADREMVPSRSKRTEVYDFIGFLSVDCDDFSIPYPVDSPEIKGQDGEKAHWIRVHPPGKEEFR